MRKTPPIKAIDTPAREQEPETVAEPQDLAPESPVEAPLAAETPEPTEEYVRTLKIGLTNITGVGDFESAGIVEMPETEFPKWLADNGLVKDGGCWRKRDLIVNIL